MTLATRLSSSRSSMVTDAHCRLWVMPLHACQAANAASEPSSKPLPASPMIRPMPGGLLTMRPGSNAGRFPATFRMSFRRSVSYDALPIVLRTPSASKRILCGEDQTSPNSLVPSLWSQQPNGNSAALNRCAVESEWCESVQRFGLLDEHPQAVKMVQRPRDSMYGGVGDLVRVALSVVTSKRGTRLDR
jgi:hypothetical protein